MREFFAWFANFVKEMVLMIFRFVTPDGFSFGYLILGTAVVGAVIAGTVGAVAIVSNFLSRRR